MSSALVEPASRQFNPPFGRIEDAPAVHSRSRFHPKISAANSLQLCLTDLMKKHPVQLGLAASLLFTLMSHATPVGEFEDHGDIGAPKLAGNASYDEASQEYTLSGAGTNMWLAVLDQFHFVWKKFGGDFILRTRAQFAGPGSWTIVKWAGWCAPIWTPMRLTPIAPSMAAD